MVLARKAEEMGERKFWMAGLVLFLAAFLFLYWPASSLAEWSPLIHRLVADGFDAQAVRNLFSRPEAQFEPGAMSSKMTELLRSQFAREEMSSPLAKRKKVMKGFLQDQVLAKARSFIHENRMVLETIDSLYGVPKEIIVSIFLIETRLGEYVGERLAFNRLASMALCVDLDKIRPYVSRRLLNPRTEDYARERCAEKANWAYAELKALLEYATKSGLDPLRIPGSTYGAIGLCQFMPSNISPFGVDADQDGRIDLFATSDALHSMANYLRGHGWSENMPLSSQHRVIFEYNRSSVYVHTVLAVADRLKEKPRDKHRLG